MTRAQALAVWFVVAAVVAAVAAVAAVVAVDLAVIVYSVESSIPDLLNFVGMKAHMGL